ncbi:MAG: peptidyl-prolyl cis-trans isomerase [Archangium sp.]|nr:peptidyl-prolyl cis-trans isomerase [Archangium sp.]
MGPLWYARVVRCLVASVVVGLLACSQQQKPQPDANVVATVNGAVIGKAEFELELGREAQSMESVATRTPEQIEPYKQTLLATMVERLVLLQAAAAANITVTSEEVDRRMLALASEYAANTFDEVLAQTHTSRTELARKTREQLLIEKLFQEAVFSRIAVTEDAIRRAYDEHPEAYTEPEQVHAQQIVVKGLDEAKRIQQQLWQGKKFADLARRYSLSPDAKVGGDLGVFRRGEMPQAFDEVVFKLAPGGLSDVVSTEYGFHVFKVLEKKPARKRDLPEVRAAIEQKLVAELRAERQREFVAGLRAKADVKVNESALQTVTGRPMGGMPREP